MKLQSPMLRDSLLLLAVILAFGVLAGALHAQENPAANDKAAPAGKFPAAKKSAPESAATDAGVDSDTAKEGKFDKDSPEAIFKREEWFYQQRAFPLGHIPAGARLRAFEHMQRMMEREGKLIRQPDGSFIMPSVSPLAPATGSWNPIGPKPTTGGFFSPVSGRITTIAVDPTDPTGDTVLIGGAQGGIWRSIDGGANWKSVGDANPSLAMGSIAFAPSAPANVYAGTGEQNNAGDSYYGAGVLKSIDGGITWNPTCPTPAPSCNNPFIGPFSTGFSPGGGARISSMAVNPTNPNLVLAGVQVFPGANSAGVYCSNDGGLNWTNILPGQMATFVGFASSSVALAALGRPFGSVSGQTNTNGVYRSSNASGICSAITFQNLTTLANSGLPATNVGRIDMGIDSTGNTIYASIADSSTGSRTNQGIWTTINGGTTWTPTNAPDICQQQCWYDNVVKVDPNNSNTVFFGGSASGQNGGLPWVMRSTNGGTTWGAAIPNAQGPGLPHVDQHAMAFFRATSGTFAGKVRMYLGNDGGAWRTDDVEASTVTWTNLNNNLTLAQFYPSLSLHPSNPNIAFAGTQDNGSQDLGVALLAQNWVDNNTCGDGGWTAIDPNVPSTVFVTCQDLNINRSVTNGTPRSFSRVINGIDPAGVSFIPPITIDPLLSNQLYFGTNKVWQTVNSGDSWVAISPVLSNNSASLTTVAVAAKSSSVVYAGSRDGGVFVATNVTPGAATFNQVGIPQLPTRSVTMVVPDPNDVSGQTAYATFSGFAFGTDLKGHIFRTINAGTLWTDVSCSALDCRTPALGDLPNIPVNDLVVDPDSSGMLYAATDLGVFQGTCTLTSCTWTTLGTGLPNVAVLSLRLHQPSRLLMAATHGRGAWYFNLNNFSFTGPHIAELTPASANAGTTFQTILLYGSGFAPGGVAGSIQWDGSTNGVTTNPQPGSADIQIQALLADSLVAAGGTHKITVTAGGLTSNALTFTVLGTAPTITSVSPTSAPVNTSPNQQITVTGTNFGSNSKVMMNPDVGGTAIPTNFVSSTQLAATIPASFMAAYGSTNSVGVQNPPPGGGTTFTTRTVTLPTFVVVALAPANDNFVNAINITTTSFTDTKDSSGAITETTDPTPACAQDPRIPFVTGRSNTIWYKFTPGSSGTANLDTIGSSYDTVLSVWTGSTGSLTAVACNDDINQGIVIQSQITNLALSAGTTYFIMVSSFGAPDPNPVAFGGKSVFNFSFTGTATATFTVGGTAVTVTAGSSNTSTITVTPQNGFTGAVAITCGSLPGVSCSALSVNVTNPNLATGQLTINVTGPSSSTTAMQLPNMQNLWAATLPVTHHARSGWWTLSGGTGFAAIFLLLVPGRKRYRAALGLGLVCLLSFALGCGGGYGGGGDGGGPVATTTKMTVSSTKVPSTGPNATITVSAAVTATGATPAGSVQFFDGMTALGSPVPLSGGSTGQITLTPASAPPFFQLVATHSVSAHYLGDASTQASQSGTLNITITGTTPLPITGTSGTTTANGTVNLTIQ